MGVILSSERSESFYHLVKKRPHFKKQTKDKICPPTS